MVASEATKAEISDAMDTMMEEVGQTDAVASVNVCFFINLLDYESCSMTF